MSAGDVKQRCIFFVDASRELIYLYLVFCSWNNDVCFWCPLSVSLFFDSLSSPRLCSRSEDFRNFIDSCLQKIPQDRPHSDDMLGVSVRTCADVPYTATQTESSRVTVLRCDTDEPSVDEAPCDVCTLFSPHISFYFDSLILRFRINWQRHTQPKHVQTHTHAHRACCNYYGDVTSGSIVKSLSSCRLAC